MIIVQLKGGLGNQLFQYAAGYCLAKYHETIAKVDAALLQRPDDEIGTFRAMELGKVNQPPAIATPGETAPFTQQHLFQKLTGRLQPPHKRSVYREPSFNFDPHFFEAKKEVYLKGYWQSWKYIEPYKNEVRLALSVADDYVQDVQSIATQIAATESVAIHIRRGDYSNPQLAAYHGLLAADYYQQAIALIQKKLADPTLYVFTDDEAWVEENLALPQQAIFVSGKLSHSAIHDFYLMSQCRHQIIANSTFSWWAAWLNPNPNKLVIAPKKWFNKPGLDSSDLVPPEWMRL